MASETVSSLDHPSAPEASMQVVEKKEFDEAKTMKEYVSPLKETEEMTKEAEKKESEEVKTKAEDVEEVTKIEVEIPKSAEQEEKVEEKPKAEDVSEEKQEVENSSPPPAESEEKVEDKSTEACNEKGEIKSDVPENTDEKREIESSKSDVIEENTEEVIKKTTNVPESSVDAVMKAEEEKKEALPEKETEVAAGKDAETSQVEHTKQVIPEAVIAEEEKPDELSDEAALGASLLKPQTEEIDQENVKPDVDKENNIEEKATLEDVVKGNESTNDADTIKETKKDAPVEDVPVTKSKQSNNILRKMKHSLMKAKKAIIGKSANSKTPSSEMKAGIEA